MFRLYYKHIEEPCEIDNSYICRVDWFSESLGEFKELEQAKKELLENVEKDFTMSIADIKKYVNEYECKQGVYSDTMIAIPDGYFCYDIYFISEEQEEEQEEDYIGYNRNDVMFYTEFQDYDVLRQEVWHD